jgi:Tol biopolymer transport system component
MDDLTQLERDVTVMLRDRAGAESRAPLAAARVARRARRRRAVNTVSAAAVVVLFAVGGTAFWRSVATDAVMPPPPAVPITVHDNGVLVTHDVAGLRAVTADGASSSLLLGAGPAMKKGLWSPTWSPDGSQLAFFAGQLSLNSDNDSVGLYVTNADGSNLRKLTGCPEIYACGVALGSRLSWSPDGRNIALTSGHLYVVDVADGALRRLPAGVGVVFPAWSSDGSVIAFFHGLQVRSIPAAADERDTSQVTTLVDGLRGVTSLDWSPDGTRLVVSAVDGLYVVEATGTTTLKVVGQQRAEGPGAATWSPDGTRIVYFSTPKTPDGFTAELHVVDPDTGHDQALFVTPCCVGDWFPPAWSPDGTRIALSVGIDGHPERSGLFLVPSDGIGDAVRVPVDGLQADPAWQPLP